MDGIININTWLLNVFLPRELLFKSFFIVNFFQVDVDLDRRLR